MPLITALTLPLFIASASASASASANSISRMDFAYVEGGEFDMGAEIENEDMGRSIRPVHRVKVSSFCIATKEVTVSQYRTFVKATHRTMPKAPPWGWSPHHPIVNVSWYDASAFAAWAGGRLPTEAEWEFAAKGGILSSGFQYSGGNNLLDVAWIRENASGRTQDVGTRKPNELGLYDMTGNVFEWTADWWQIDYYQNSPRDNPHGPSTGTLKTARGGSWYYKGGWIQLPAIRYQTEPATGTDGIGIRVAKSARHQGNRVEC